MDVAVKHYESWLLSRGYAQETAKLYASFMVKLLENAVVYMRGLTCHTTWRLSRNAAQRWVEYCGDELVWERIRRLPGPRKPAPRPRAIPRLDEWWQIGRTVWRHRGPGGAILWLVVFSGMRIGDILTLTRAEIQEAAGRGRVARVRQKGSGGEGSREWIVGPLSRPAVARLAPEIGYRYLFQLICPTRCGAQNWIRARIPRPYSPHSFRHATVTYLESLGIPAIVGMRITGHSSLTAYQRYTHAAIGVSPETAEAALERLGRAILAADRGVNDTPKPGGTTS